MSSKRIYEINNCSNLNKQVGLLQDTQALGYKYVIAKHVY